MGRPHRADGRFSAGSALGWFVVLGGLLLVAAAGWRHAEPVVPTPAPPLSPASGSPGPSRSAGPLPSMSRPVEPASAGVASAPSAIASQARLVPPLPAPFVPASAATPPASLAVTDGAGGPAAAPDDSSADVARLAARALLIPVQGVEPQQLVDTYNQARESGARRHDAIDILAPTGTPVRAVEDGRVAKLFISKAGGITVYQFDPGEQYVYYYAHLDHYAEGLHEGQMLRRGDVIGAVGATGNANADAPHLHFAITRLEADKAWWRGQALNPYPVLRGTR